ncbi:MAG TPA: hypothetical protein VJI74_02935 [Candidatus Paceibacterota bacterium]
MTWCFGIVRGRLAEVYFESRGEGEKLPFAHCYVSKKEYKTKQEQRWIVEDTKRTWFSFHSKRYRLLPSN